MFDKWLNEEIAIPLQKRKRVVIADESNHHELIKKVLPEGIKLFTVNSDLEELDCKYTIEKFHRNDPVVILTARPKSRLTFIRDYCETCGCIEIRKFETYLNQKIFDKLGMNISLSGKELEAAAFNSITKGEAYWEDLCRKGSDRLFDIGTEILPFLNDPQGYFKSHDAVVMAAFFDKVNIWLGRASIEQPPETLANEVAQKILGSLLQSKPEEKYLSVYVKWLNSRAEEESLFSYARELQEQMSVQEPWGVYATHPFSAVDEIWFTDITQNLHDGSYIKSRLPKIRARVKTHNGKKWKNGLWSRVLTLLEFDTSDIKKLTDVDSAVLFYTEKLFKVDSAIRVIYEEFWGKNDFQEVVLTSDHGFVLTGLLDESDKMEVQFQGEISKAERFIRTVEKQQLTNDLVEYKQNYGIYQYVYFAKNMKPFKTPGKYGYAHGGIAPQELIIPFVSFSLKKSVVQELQISVENKSQLSGVVGDSFSIHIKASDNFGDIDMFSRERKIQLIFLYNGEKYSQSDIITIKAGELVKREFSFDKHNKIDVVIVDAGTIKTIAKVSVIQIVARDLGGLI